MVDASKILTVSYGTFSCTLEGFDDPFSTMRGIAEYFRDLAAEDRYFGAEPPTPDAEMLHRIAEREVQKRVEARVEDDGVTLRQIADEPSETKQTPIAVVPSETTHNLVESIDQETPEPVTVTSKPVIKAVQEIEPRSKTETVVAKLARIRALSVVEDEFDSNGDFEVTPNTLDTFEAEPISAVFDDAIEQGDRVIEFADVAEDDVDAPIDDTMEDTQDIPETIEPAEFDISEPVDEVAEANVFDGTVELEAAESEADDAHQVEDDDIIQAIHEDLNDVEFGVADKDESAVEDTVDVDVTELLADAEIQADIEDSTVDTDDETDPETDDTITSMIGATTGLNDDQDDDFDAQQSYDADDEPDAAAIARVVKMRRADFEAAQDIDDTPTSSHEIEDFMAGVGSPVPEDEDEIEVSPSLELASDIESEIEAHADYDSDAEADAEVNDDTSTLSQEDEADLMATLETVQRQEAADMRAEKEGRALLENQDIESSADSVSRILDLTNTEMEETEGTRRRSAIAHLKAAVAATRADRFLGRGKAENETKEMNKYRDDLAKVVRPSRPATNDKPKSRRQAPLVLVSEQRIDEDTAEVDTEAEVIMPRRITSGNLALDEAGREGENIFRDGHSFADFAEEMGAKELPDLLEAAAAFSSFVEGRETFSRPQIMKAVAGLNEEREFTREESLRSFGLLLRRGKIKKIKRGQFTIAETTRFNPEVRAVGE